MKRREFLQLAGAASAASVARGAMAQAVRGIVITMDTTDPVAGAAPVRWAAEQLRMALTAKGAWCRVVTAPLHARGAAFFVVVNATALTTSRNAPHAALGAESFVLAAGRHEGVPATIVSGSDVRGYVYGLLELAERVQFGANPAQALRLTKPIEEKPANEVRSVAAIFAANSKTSRGCTTGISGLDTWTCWPRAASTASALGLDWSTTFPRV